MFLPYFDEESTVTLPFEALINGGSFMLMCLIVTQVFQFEPKKSASELPNKPLFFQLSGFFKSLFQVGTMKYESRKLSLSL